MAFLGSIEPDIGIRYNNHYTKGPSDVDVWFHVSINMSRFAARRFVCVFPHNYPLLVPNFSLSRPLKFHTSRSITLQSLKCSRNDVIDVGRFWVQVIHTSMTVSKEAKGDNQMGILSAPSVFIDHFYTCIHMPVPLYPPHKERLLVQAYRKAYCIAMWVGYHVRLSQD
jgi:hypothetical protein